MIIGKRNFFEADHLIDIFSLEKGCVRAVVKGAKKSTSKLAGNTELFTYGVFGLAKGKSLDIITSVKPIDHFRATTENLEKVSHFFLICEALNRFLPQGSENKTVFKETLAVLNIINKNNHLFLVYEYLYKIIIILGYGPSLDICANCLGQTEKQSKYFDLLSGGLLCEECSKKGNPNIFKLSENTIKILSFVENNDIEKYSKLKFDKETGEEFALFIEKYLEYIYQKDLKSTNFIKKIKTLQ